MKISIVIPNWNGEAKLAKNLPKVLATKGIEEFIVVDDASTDNSLLVLEKFPSIKIIKRAKNGGFASTVNIGVAEASGDVIYLVNSDAVPGQESALTAIKHFDDPRVFSVSCNSGGNWSWIKFKDGFLWHFKSESETETHQTLWASGGGGLFRKKTWDELGGLDELFSPFYEEDTDLGYRATKRGFVNIWDKDAIIEHYKEKGVIEEHFSKREVAAVAQRNQLYLIWKNITDSNLLNQHILGLIKTTITHPKYLFVIFSALVNLTSVLQKRQMEKSFSKLTDREILDKYPSS